MRFWIYICVLLINCVPVVADTQVPRSMGEIALSFTPVVKKSSPAVVNIYAKRIVQTTHSPFQNDPFFRDFFNQFAPARPRVQNSLGSGVILSKDGFVVSNYHVVGKASEISVDLNDGRSFSAQVILSDEQSDLAILQLDDAADMPFLRLRNSETVEVGELVLAIGNPFGVGQTVTSGIVSGLARSGAAVGTGRGYFLQTDAAINPGNSGGALVDINGDLIGINTSILTRSGGSNGIGFAIPSALVTQFLSQARQGNTRFLRPWAGMSGQPLTSELAQEFGIHSQNGMVITELHAKSPFNNAGLKVGDIIIAAQGLAINSPDELIYRMSVLGVGQKMVIDVLNRAGEGQYTIDLGAAPNDPISELVTLPNDSLLRGMSIRLINPSVQQALGLPFDANGFVVVDSGPIAPRIGLQTGDVIVSINDIPLENAHQVDALIKQGGRRGQFLISRMGRQIVLRFRI